MTWYAWVMIVMVALSVMSRVAIIGRPRDPLTPEDVIVSMIANGLLIWGIVELATR